MFSLIMISINFISIDNNNNNKSGNIL